MGKLFREPLLHFLVLGALLFALYGGIGSGGAEPGGEIVVDAGRIASLEAQFERLWQRRPSAAERAGLVETFVREEVLYREGVALGLDRDDPVIRRRVGQKMGFLADGLAPEAPTDAELQAWLDAHPADYESEARTSLEQVFFDPSRHGAALDGELASAQAALAQGAAARALGDRTLLPAALERAPASEVERQFGRAFAAAVAELPAGAWEPVRSGYGVHLVRVTAREGARRPALDAVRAEVARDLLHERAQEANEAFYQDLRARYTVRIEGAGAGPPGGAAERP
ncbi:MAG: peptidyl-prolyl cis-trans isomerase [Deltaproteobacteria bacterium]|nr:peptidyl-prolyl cis-trans isomerase [Deltaproteobacteria bacterium]